MRFVSVLAVCGLAACVPSPGADVSMNRSKVASAPIMAMPSEMARFGTLAAAPPNRSNATIAQDFMELAFRMESGRALPVLTRFEGPVTVRMSGPVPENAATDLARLLQRIRNEAGIDLREVAADTASINIEFVPRAQIQSTFANVACFVVPRVASWAEFRAARHGDALDWTTLVRRDRVAVFVPADSSAQEVRDCLHEELAQALGPLNDL
ncbi:MAG: DUF2927 domain-containing protein, partial [Paracoccaceae bacterium]|nr:DUF2927 domain-containing protein [Paracoccaceae bacterium]